MKVLINNRNRLTTTREMTLWFWDNVPYVEVVILDNASTYKPLLEWYFLVAGMTDTKIVRSAKNWGPRAAWDCPEFRAEIPKDDHYAVTDSDLDLSGCPADLLYRMSVELKQHEELCKVGVSLAIDDIPDGYPHKKLVVDREKQFWKESFSDTLWKADIETTLAVYCSWPCIYGPAARLKPPYVARHVPWYITPEMITDEEKFYIRNCDVPGPIYSKLAQKYNFVGGTE